MLEVISQKRNDKTVSDYNCEKHSLKIRKYINNWLFLRYLP